MNSMHDPEGAVLDSKRENDSDIVPDENQTCDCIIDWQDLEHRVDNEELVKKMAELLIEQYPEKIEALAHAVVASQIDQVDSRAHALKGAAGSIGARALMEAACQLEIASRDGNAKSLPERFERVQDEFEKLRTFLSQENWIELAKDTSVHTLPVS